MVKVIDEKAWPMGLRPPLSATSPAASLECSGAIGRSAWTGMAGSAVPFRLEQHVGHIWATEVVPTRISCM